MLLWPGPRVAVVTLGRNLTNSSTVEMFSCVSVSPVSAWIDKRDVLQAFRAALRGDDHFLEPTAGRCLRPDSLSRAGGKHGGYRGCESVIHAISDPQGFVLSTQRPPLAGARYPL